MTSANKPERLAGLQTAFAAHIRDPENVPAPPGVEDRRMQVYRELFFNNIAKFLSGNFPVLRSLYDTAGWTRLVRDFYTEHRAHTPLFPELPKEFLRYLQEGRAGRAGDPAFLLELAHYEWVELALSLDTRELQDVAVDGETDFLHGIPVLSPLAWPLSYRFPVHRISPDFQPAEPAQEASHLLVYRNRDDRVKFMQLNEVSRLLLSLMAEQPAANGIELLTQVAERIQHPDPDKVLEHGARLMSDLHARDVLLGTRASSSG